MSFFLFFPTEVCSRFCDSVTYCTAYTSMKAPAKSCLLYFDGRVNVKFVEKFLKMDKSLVVPKPGVTVGVKSGILGCGYFQLVMEARSKCNNR